jgi:hypothetical protein
MTRHGLTAGQIQIIVMLQSGEELHTLAARPALTWVAFDTEDDETRIVPMAAVQQIRVRRRPGAPATVGFSVPAASEPANGEQTVQPATVS